jgi:hypothetical protein
VIYPILLSAGFIGLVAMMFMGFIHHGPSQPNHHQLPGGHPHGIHPPHLLHAPPPAPGAPVFPAHHTPNLPAMPQIPVNGQVPVVPSQANTSFTWIAPLLSPLHWFSWMVGAGAAGSLARFAGAGTIVAAVCAAGGAVGFQRYILQPVWDLVFGFESRPAGNLKACLMQEVEVVTSFNARGEGLVRVVVDGHSEDILAKLIAEEGAGDSRPKRGDRLRIEEVDPHKNTCRVSRSQS